MPGEEQSHTHEPGEEGTKITKEEIVDQHAIMARGRVDDASSDGRGENDCSKSFIDMKESLKKLIEDDLLFDAMIKSRNVIIQQKIMKGEALEGTHIFNTSEEMSVTKVAAIEQFREKFAASSLKIINDVARDVRDKHTVAIREYNRKKKEMKSLVDSCTVYITWADFLIANKDAIMLQKRCGVLNDIAEELENKAENYGAATQY